MDEFRNWIELPDDEFRLILDELSFQDIANFRCVCKGMKRRITMLLKSKFNKFSINGINRENCNEISETLILALGEPYAPVWLELEICFKLDLRMTQILQNSSNALTSLVINIKGNEEFLLNPGFRFENLESLEINDHDEDGVKCYDEDYYNTKVTVVEAMLSKHASNLKNLTVKDLEKSITVPALPKLDSLSLLRVGEEPVCSLLDQTRHTITSLEIDKLILNVDSTTPLTDVDSTNDAFFEIQNLNHLKIESVDFKFILHNSEHLMSLVVNKFPGYTFYWNNISNIESPQLPNLRELGMGIAQYPRLLGTIMRQNIKSLELLVIESRCYILEDVIMPKLTDLYVIEGRFFVEFFHSNHKSLEYLFLIDSEISHFNYGSIRMEKMELVVLKSTNDSIYSKYSEDDRDKMAVMCPNADVVLLNEENEVEIMNRIKQRCKRKNFSTDITRLIELDYWHTWYDCEYC